MKMLNDQNIQVINGGMGTYPGYKWEDHMRGNRLLTHGTVGFIVGLVESFYENALDAAR